MAQQKRNEAAKKSGAGHVFAVIGKVMENATVEIPEAMIERQIDSMIRNFEARLAQQGLKLADFMKYTGQDEKSFRGQYRDQAEKSVRANLVLEAIENVENFEVSDEEIDAVFTVADALRDIIDTPISPELIPADAEGNITQKTEDLVGPYELHDFFLYYALRWGFGPKKVFRLALYALGGRYERDFILKWLKNFYRRFFNQQFKRSCMPDGPKVGSVCLSPRGDWRMPSDASSALWRL